MASRLLRHIAVTIGAGLATGIGIASVSRKPRRRAAPSFAPVLTRIEDIETRVARVEKLPAPVLPSPEEIEALGTIVSSQNEEIASLRETIERIEARNAEQVEAFAKKLALVEEQVPAHIEAAVDARIADLEHKLRGEFEEIHHRTVDAFAENIEKRVVDRIRSLESSLAEQSQSIAVLREKSLHTDDNLQRLLDAVEKLCARAESQAYIAPPPPPMPKPEPEPEPELQMSGSGWSMKAFGMALVGLGVIGLRLLR